MCVDLAPSAPPISDLCGPVGGPTGKWPRGTRKLAPGLAKPLREAKNGRTRLTEAAIGRHALRQPRGDDRGGSGEPDHARSRAKGLIARSLVSIAGPSARSAGAAKSTHLLVPRAVRMPPRSASLPDSPRQLTSARGSVAPTCPHHGQRPPLVRAQRARQTHGLQTSLPRRAPPAAQFLVPL